MNHPNSVFINNRGFARLMAGYPDSALIDFNQSLLLNPKNAWAYRNKGIYHLEKNETEEALRLLQKARELDNNVEEINYYIGLVYLKMGLHAETCTALSRGKELNDLRALELYEEHCLN